MSWQKILAQGFTSASDLLSYLELPVSSNYLLAEKKFSSRIPLGFAQRMEKGNPHDPLLLQVLASKEELLDVQGYETDPLMEHSFIPLKGLIHKYHGRVLLTVTGACAVNCRFCFRRHFPYQEHNPGRNGWNEVCNYIAKDSSITEVILSGGDPLLASNVILKDLIRQLDGIPHIHTIRIHTRFPVVLPERIDSGLLSLLNESRLQKVIVLHTNHSQELNESVQQACRQLHQVGCVLLNQTVLLAQINDDAVTLAELSQRLFGYGVMPYYLHILDKVKGTAHFDVPFTRAQIIYKKLRTLLPGYLVPRLVQEKPGEKNKTLLI